MPSCLGKRNSARNTKCHINIGLQFYFKFHAKTEMNRKFCANWLRQTFPFKQSPDCEYFYQQTFHQKNMRVTCVFFISQSSLLMIWIAEWIFVWKNNVFRKKGVRSSAENGISFIFSDNVSFRFVVAPQGATHACRDVRARVCMCVCVVRARVCVRAPNFFSPPKI